MTSLLEKLSFETGLRAASVQRIMFNAPYRYKFYSIEKRSGRGFRQIAQPAREVKVVQRALAKVLLNEIPLHDCATAYRTGKSVLHNAMPHAGHGPILKLDFKDFFPSLLSRDWVNFCNKTGCLIDADDIALTSRLLFHHQPNKSALRLAIGAPSSPVLSNILMKEFDELVFSSVAEDFVFYTRYADDMTFSAPRTGNLQGVITKVARIVRKLRSPNLTLNPEKTTYVTTKYHRAVTGLTLANDGRITIGRQKKREISAAVHNALHGKLTGEQLQVLAGSLAFINSVEASFIEKLREKYGNKILVDIQERVLMGVRPAPHDPPIALK